MLTGFDKTHYLYASDRVSPVLFLAQRRKCPRRLPLIRCLPKKKTRHVAAFTGCDRLIGCSWRCHWLFSSVSFPLGRTKLCCSLSPELRSFRWLPGSVGPRNVSVHVPAPGSGDCSTPPWATLPS